MLLRLKSNKNKYSRITCVVRYQHMNLDQYLRFQKGVFDFGVMGAIGMKTKFKMGHIILLAIENSIFE